MNITFKVDAELDQINRRTWRTRNVLDQYRDLEGYIDPGERAATDWLRDECRGRPILDIGVGCGRTVPLLRAISEDYIGADYTQELLDVAIRKHPQVRFLNVDARDMTRFEDESFYLVNFSYNAIDAVNRLDRIKILNEVRRVLKPGGLFLFSAHNRQGPGTHEGLAQLLPGFTRNPFKFAWRAARKMVELPLGLRNYLRFHRVRIEREDHVIANAAAHNFGLILLYTSFTDQVAQLATCGFRVEAAFDSARGAPVTGDVPGVWWFHYIARKQTNH